MLVVIILKAPTAVLHSMLYSCTTAARRTAAPASRAKMQWTGKWTMDDTMAQRNNTGHWTLEDAKLRHWSVLNGRPQEPLRDILFRRCDDPPPTTSHTFTMATTCCCCFRCCCRAASNTEDCRHQMGCCCGCCDSSCLTMGGVWGHNTTPAVGHHFGLSPCQRCV